MKSMSIHKVVDCSLITLALWCLVFFTSSLFASTKEQQVVQEFVFSCEDVENSGVEDARAFTSFEKNLIQVGLFHLFDEFGYSNDPNEQQLRLLRDGEIGHDTKAKVKEFCKGISADEKMNLIDSMFLYASLKSIEPNCKGMAKVSGLRKWIEDRKDDGIKGWVQSVLTNCEHESKDENINVNQYFILRGDDFAAIMDLAADVEAAKALEEQRKLAFDTASAELAKAQEENSADDSLVQALSTAEKDLEKASKDSNTKAEKLANLEALVELLTPLKDKAFASEQLFLAKALSTIGESDALSALGQEKQSKKALAALARKPIVIAPYPLKAADCDCVEDFVYNDKLYHFYPGFIGNITPEPSLIDKVIPGEDAPPPRALIDYSIASRIAFQGMSLNKAGKIPSVFVEKDGLPIAFEPLDAFNQQRDQFITQAHKHFTKADVVFELKSWLLWNTESIENAIGTLKESILINTPSNSLHWDYRATKQIDGLVLYFNNFEQDQAHSEKLSKIVKAFLGLKTQYEHLHISIVLDMPLCTNADNCSNISDEQLSNSFNICDIAVGGKPDEADKQLRCGINEKAVTQSVDNILVFLPSETTHSKKYLRRLVEEKFKGEARSKMLNKLIPIVSPYPLNANNTLDLSILEDDLIYAKYNFGGTAFWPMPLATDEHYKDLYTIVDDVMIDIGGLSESLANPEQTNKIQILIRSVLPTSFCELLCTQRYQFRILFDALVVFMLATLIFKNASCYLCKIIDKHYVAYISLWVPITLLFVSMLGCDRFWNNKADIALLVLFLIGVFVAAANYIVSVRRAKDLQEISVAESKSK